VTRRPVCPLTPSTTSSQEGGGDRSTSSRWTWRGGGPHPLRQLFRMAAAGPCSLRRGTRPRGGEDRRQLDASPRPGALERSHHWRWSSGTERQFTLPGIAAARPTRPSNGRVARAVTWTPARAIASPGGQARPRGRPASCWSSASRLASWPRPPLPGGWRRSSRRWPRPPGTLPP